MSTFRRPLWTAREVRRLSKELPESDASSAELPWQRLPVRSGSAQVALLNSSKKSTRLIRGTPWDLSELSESPGGKSLSSAGESREPAEIQDPVAVSPLDNTTHNLLTASVPPLFLWNICVKKKKKRKPFHG